MGGGGNWEVGWEDKMLFAMVVAYGRGSVCEFILVRVGSCSKMIFQGRWKEGGGGVMEYMFGMLVEHRGWQVDN